MADVAKQDDTKKGDTDIAVVPSHTAGQSSTLADDILGLENLKEIDEEVQYVIAQQQGPQLSATSKETWILYAICLVAFLNATSSGFDGALMGSINAETQYKVPT